MKRTPLFVILTLVQIFACSVKAFAQQPNSMSTAYDAGTFSACGTSSFSNLILNGSGYNSYYNAGNAAWHKFTLAGTSNVNISLCESSFDTYLYLADASGSPIASNDDSGPLCTGLKSSLSMTNLGSGTYYIVSGGFASATGSLTIELTVEGTQVLPSAGSGTANAIVVPSFGSAGGTFTDSRTNQDPCLSNFIGQPSNDIYYKFTLTSSGMVGISNCGSALSDTYMHLLDNSGTEIASNDDFGPLCASRNSSIQMSLVAGTYYVVSEGYSYNSGVITTTITVPPSAVGTAGCALLAAAPSADQNYVATYTPRMEFSNVNDIYNATACDVMATIQYVDGLGRPLQTVQVKGSPSKNDMVQPTVYDQFGREAKKYLPYSTAAGVPGSYRPDAMTPGSGVYSFYNPGGNGISGSQQTTGISTGVVVIPEPSASTGFEPSPLNRPVEQGATGDAWQLSTSGITGSGHTVRMEYATNDAAAINSGTGYWARLYTVDMDVNGSRALNDHGTGYDQNQLYVTVTKDENWQNGQQHPKDHTTEEYKDKEGHVLLKRTFNSGETLSTYYVYDDLNNLAFVLTPKAEPDNGGINQTTLDNLCYQYRYDGRQRLVEKKMPGKGWEFTVYNALNQVIFSQDANQRVKPTQEWTYAQYDAVGRVCVTGIWNSTGVPGSTGDGNISTPDRTLKQWLVGWAAAQTTLWLSRDNSTSTGYAALDPLGVTILNINYYDDYNFPGIPYSTPTTTVSSQTTSLRTGSKTVVMNPDGTYGPMLWTVNYYDDKGRTVQTFKQHYLGGVYNIGNYDETVLSYSFTNEIKTSMRHHYSALITGAPALTVSNAYFYDHMGRKYQVWQSVSMGSNPLPAPVILSQLEYSESGQLQNKKLHAEQSDYGSFIEPVTYTYNPRGWLTAMNSDKLRETLNYETSPFFGINRVNYNGNISEAWYRTPNTGDRRFYYLYDPLNRLTESRYWSFDISTGGVYNGALDEVVNYDKQGNIMTLNRGSYATLPYVYSGSFGYTYTGNQLQSVTNNSNTYRNYSYDGNGNATGNGSLGFDYNQLNLPGQVKQNNAVVIGYTYSAAGEKLRKQSGQSGTVDYIGGIQYTNGVIDFLQTEEGRYLPVSSKYQYDLKDHLGNVRAMIEKSTATTSTAVQENEYYAFGLNATKTNISPDNKYLYNGKEMQSDYDLFQLDYGARFYDPIIARWNTVDPLAEVGRRWSPYNYAKDSPNRYIDPDGMSTESWMKDHGISPKDLTNVYTAEDDVEEQQQQEQQQVQNPPSNGLRIILKLLGISVKDPVGSDEVEEKADGQDHLSTIANDSQAREEKMDNAMQFLPVVSGTYSMMKGHIKKDPWLEAAGLGGAMFDGFGGEFIKANRLAALFRKLGINMRVLEDFMGWEGQKITKGLEDFSKEELLSMGLNKENLVEMARGYNDGILKAQVKGSVNKAAIVRRDQAIGLAKRYFRE